MEPGAGPQGMGGAWGWSHREWEGPALGLRRMGGASAKATRAGAGVPRLHLRERAAQEAGGTAGGGEAMGHICQSLWW